MATHLRVSSRPESFFRCGRKFTRTPVDVPLADLKPAELKALKAEPMLAAFEVDVKPNDGKGK